MDVQLVLMGQKIIVKLFLNNVVPQQNGFPQKKSVNQKVDIVQKVLSYQVLFVSLMYHAKMDKNGIPHVLCVFVLIILSGMEIGVFLVQEEKYGLLGKAVNVVQENFSLAQDAKLLTI